MGWLVRECVIIIMTLPATIVNGCSPEDDPDPLGGFVQVCHCFCFSIGGPTHHEDNDVLRSVREGNGHD